MASDSLVFQSIAQSNLPSSQKSAIAKWYDRLKGGGALSRVRSHAIQTAEAIRAGGEGVVVGGVLGAAHAYMPDGLDVKGKVPIDALTAVAALGAAVAWPSEMSRDLHNAGTSAAAVYSFRKVYEFSAKKKMATGGVPGGRIGPKAAGDYDYSGSDMGADPILAAAEAL